MNVRIIENKSEIGAGTRGASLGIDALKIASIKKGIDLFEQVPVLVVKDENKLLFQQTPFKYAKNIDGIVRMYSKISSFVHSILRNEHLPLIISGDHSSAGGTIAGVKMAFPSKRIGVLWIDAHADLHTPFTTPSGNVHGMSLASVIGIDNKENQINPVAEQEAELWNILKNTGGVGKKIEPEDIVFVGLRSFEDQEQKLIESYGMKTFDVESMRTEGIQKSTERVLKCFEQCDMIFLSFDVDSLDPSVSIGTGTPVVGGFFIEEMKEMIDVLTKSNKISCMEITEVNPTLDHLNKMSEAVIEVLQIATKNLNKTDLSQWISKIY
tara:strand:+ start:1220 stop:2194 length:975 start_codon:yes stop_codon:yes gene_type:complete